MLRTDRTSICLAQPIQSFLYYNILAISHQYMLIVLSPNSYSFYHQKNENYDYNITLNVYL